MSSRDAYLAFLESFGLTEAEVLPMAPPLDKAPPEALGALLAGLATPPKDNEEGRETYAKLQLLAELMVAPPSTNTLLEKLHRDLLERIARLLPPIRGGVFAGVFPTKSFNAQTVAVADGFLLLLDTGCFEILEAAIGVLLSDWEQPQKVDALCTVVEQYCVGSRLPSVGEMDPPGLRGEGAGVRLELMAGLTTAAEEFVITHEYGHLAQSHLSPAPSRARAPGTSIDPLVRTRFQELEADFWANDILVRAAKPEGDMAVALAAAGPLLFLGTALLVERMFQRQGDYSDSHPDTAMRIYMVERFHDVVGVDKRKLYIGAGFLSLVDDCSRALFGEVAAPPRLDVDLERRFSELVSAMRTPGRASL